MGRSQQLVVSPLKVMVLMQLIYIIHFYMVALMRQQEDALDQEHET